jgi:hypothetical protein
MKRHSKIAGIAGGIVLLGWASHSTPVATNHLSAITFSPALSQSHPPALLRRNVILALQPGKSGTNQTALILSNSVPNHCAIEILKPSETTNYCLHVVKPRTDIHYVIQKFP